MFSRFRRPKVNFRGRTASIAVIGLYDLSGITTEQAFKEDAAAVNWVKMISTNSNASDFDRYSNDFHQACVKVDPESPHRRLAVH